MSLELPLFDVPPDFQTRPTVGPSATHEKMAEMAARAYIVFPEDTRHVLNAKYRTTTLAEQRAIDRIFHSVLGMGANLYVPSWTPEFLIKGALEADQWSLLIEGQDYGTDLLDRDRWSTLGRYIWLYRYSDGGVWGTKVLDTTLEGSEERLHLDDPLPWVGPAKDFAAGYLYLARFADDTLRTQCWLPGHSEYEITFRGSLGRPINDCHDITGIDQYGFQRLYRQCINDIDFTRTSRKVNPTVGPEILRVQQDSVFTDPWVAWFSNEGIRLKKASTVNPPADEEGVPSIFYQSSTIYDHMSLAFDQDAYECFAIQKTSTTIEVKKWLNGVHGTYTFNGWSPVLWFDGILQVDDTLTDIVCLYLDKPDSINLKARFQRDNFGTEYAIATLARAVYFLTDADTGNDRFILHGITPDGNVTTITSIDYPPAPVEIGETVPFSIAPSSGAYGSDVIGTQGDDTASMSITPESGIYQPITVATAGDDTASMSIAPADGGEYDEISVPTAGSDTASMGITPESGEVIEIAVPIELSDTAHLSITPESGTYTTP